MEQPSILDRRDEVDQGLALEQQGVVDTIVADRQPTHFNVERIACGKRGGQHAPALAVVDGEAWSMDAATIRWIQIGVLVHRRVLSLGNRS